jgi:hypothetical protein
MLRVGSFLKPALAKPGAPAPQPGWQDIPHIQQLRPEGAGRHYVGGARFCGPAVVAMLARGAGMDRQTDARFIQDLSAGIVSRNGASPQGIAKMLERVNVPPAGPALGASYSDAALQQHLSQGNKVIAQVKASDSRTGPASAHYVLVRGTTPEGNYLISDPLEPKPGEVTPSQLRQMVRGAPPDGGLLIPVGPPGSQPRTPATPATGTPSRGSPETDAAVQEILKKMGASARQESSSAGNRLMARNDLRNDFALQIDYSHGAGPRPQTSPIVPSHLSKQTFAQHLLQLKRQGDRSAYELLAQLQASPFLGDQRVADAVMRVDLKQPGIGKKTLGDPA